MRGGFQKKSFLQLQAEKKLVLFKNELRLVNGSQEVSNDDFTFEDNYSSRSSRKSRKHNESNAVTMSESSDDDDTSDEEYSSHSGSDSSDDDQQYDSEAASKHYKRMRIYGCPTNVIYHQSNLLTKINIHQQQELCFIAPLAERRKQQQQPDLKAVKISERKDIQRSEMICESFGFHSGVIGESSGTHWNVIKEQSWSHLAVFRESICGSLLTPQ